MVERQAQPPRRGVPPAPRPNGQRAVPDPPDPAAPHWLPEVALALDVDAPVTDPDALVVNAAGENAVVDRLVARLVAERPGRVVVLLGSPFTSDDLVPERTSARLRSLAGFGVP